MNNANLLRWGPDFGHGGELRGRRRCLPASRSGALTLGLVVPSSECAPWPVLFPKRFVRIRIG